MRTAILFLTLLLGLLANTADAVSLDSSGRNAQVLIFPAFTTIGGYETDFTIRNNTNQGKALRVLTKDSLGGRPTISVNVYLKPGDSWNARLVGKPAFSATLVSNDESCTIPRVTFPSATPAQLDSNLDSERLPRSQLNTGYIEVFEMGEISAELAADCDGIERRFLDGVWSTGEVMVNQDVSQPGGGLSGMSYIRDTDRGNTLAFRPTGLADFSTVPNHTVSRRAGRPSLANVVPAEAQIDGQTFAFSASPINAVEAALMTQQLSAEYFSERQTRAFANAMVLFPTRPFHANPGFYRAFSESPFDVNDTQVSGNLVDNTGDRLDDVSPPTAGQQCDRYTAALNFVSLIDFFAFSAVCELGEAQLFLFDDDVRGVLELPMIGAVVADDGTTFNGLPAIGHLLQTTTANADEFGVYAVPMIRQ
ncbi:MAG: hypothetical protein AB8B96_10090 [Lysobacterales bacterium]